jgi:hypothetical protein
MTVLSHLALVSAAFVFGGLAGIVLTRAGVRWGVSRQGNAIILASSLLAGTMAWLLVGAVFGAWR